MKLVTKDVRLIAIVLALVEIPCILLFVYYGLLHGAHQDTMNIPPELRPLYEERKKWLDEKLVEWKPSKWVPMMFNGHHILASSMMVRNTDEEIDKLFLDMLCELNVDSISLYIFEPNYWKYRDRYSKLIRMIKERRKKLILYAYTFPRKKESLDDFFYRFLNFELLIVKNYKPDFFIVLLEPSVIGGVEMPPEKLREFAVKAVKEIKAVSPKTVLAVIVHTGELKLIPYFVDVEGLDIIGINVYGVRSWKTLSMLSSTLRSAVKSRGFSRRGGCRRRGVKSTIFGLETATGRELLQSGLESWCTLLRSTA